MREARLLALVVLVAMLVAVPLMAQPVTRPDQTGIAAHHVDVAAIQSLASASGPESSVSQLRGHAPPSPNYDEQIGLTFTQNFNSLVYNVTAVAQTDPTLDTGPGYLLSALTSAPGGYWYQVGLSYNWSPGSVPGTGFAMSYEVFNPSGNSIFPTNGGGGLMSFTGNINPGDNVTLKLTFSSGQVVMSAEDANTKAAASTSYPSFGATMFQGQPTSDANSIGFFTGLMTEWYHGIPGFQEPAETIYSTNSSISSGWMWMDEFNANNLALVFESNSTTISAYSSDPALLQPFSYQGITEYSSGFEFITGSPLISTTTTTSSSSASSVSTVTVTTTVPVTTTQTVTATATVTVTQQVTATVTQNPTTVTVTSTDVLPPSVTTTTETSTTTQTVNSGALPPWSYALVLAALLVGIIGGYLLRRPSGAGPVQQPTPMP